MKQLNTLNGWERLWLIATAVAIVGAIFYTLQIKDYKDLRLSASCIAFTVSHPKEDYSEAKARLQQVLQTATYPPPNALDRNGRLILEPTPRTPTAEEQIFGMQELMGNFDYSCTTYESVSKNIFFALLASLVLFAGGHLAVWVKRGF